MTKPLLSQCVHETKTITKQNPNSKKRPHKNLAFLWRYAPIRCTGTFPAEKFLRIITTMIKTCCSNDGERPHRCCRLPNKVENIDLIPYILNTLQWAGRCTPPKCPFWGGKISQANTRFLVLTWVHIANGISIGSGVFAQLRLWPTDPLYL